MNTCTTSSIVTFSSAFLLSGDQDELPAGDYEIVVEEELLQGLSFAAYRRTATHMMVHGRGNHAGRNEMRQVTEKYLNAALVRDRATTKVRIDGEAAPSPLEDLS
jgi:hypothetical protein